MRCALKVVAFNYAEIVHSILVMQCSYANQMLSGGFAGLPAIPSVAHGKSKLLFLTENRYYQLVHFLLRNNGHLIRWRFKAEAKK